MKEKFEIYPKYKVNKLIEQGVEFWIIDIDKKRTYNSNDLRLREISEKLEKEKSFIVKEARYSRL